MTLNTLRTELSAEQLFVLIFNLWPADSEEPAIEALDARLFIDEPTAFIKGFSREPAASWSDIEKRVVAIVRECRTIVLEQYQRDDDALLVEFLMPAAFIEQAPDDIRLKISGMLRSLGALHPVVIRLRERSINRRDALNLREWETAAARIDRDARPTVHWMTSPRKGPAIKDCRGVVVLRFLPSADLLDIVCQGFPFMAWLRSEPDGGNWDAFEQEFTAMMGKPPLRNLARDVRGIRTAMPGVSLTLLWDDPKTRRWRPLNDVSGGDR